MSITVPVLNGIAKNSGIFQFDTNKSYVTISTIADQNLTLTLYQSFDNGGNFDYSDSHNIIANVDVTHIFPKRGTTCYFSLENNSGTNCTFTRSYSDQVDNVNNDNSGDKQDVSDSITHTKLDGVKTSVDNLADATLNVSGTVNIGSTVNIGNAVLDVSDTFSHTKLDAVKTSVDTVKTSVDTVNTTLNGTLDVTGSSVSVSNTVQVANTDLGFLSDINTKLGATLTTTDSTTHTKLDGVKTSVDTINTTLGTTLTTTDATTHTKLDIIIGSLVDIDDRVVDLNTTLSGTLTTTDATTHTKLTTIDGTLSDIDDRVAEINTTLSGTLTTTDATTHTNLGTINTTLGGTLTTTDATTHTNLGTINTTLNGTLDVCPMLCRPLLVATIFNSTSGSTAVNVLDGAFKLVGFSYAHSDNQGCLSFYDVAAAGTAPTSTSTALFSVAATTANLSSPSFPTSSYINFVNGLWIRINSNIDPTNTANEAGTVTLYYEV